MALFDRFSRRLVLGWGLTLLLLVSATLPDKAAATLSEQIDPAVANVGDEVGVTITIKNGEASNLALPHVDGLQVAGSSSSTQLMFNGGTLTSASSQTFTIIPVRPGDFVIPAFDVQTQGGAVLHAQAMKLHVVTGGALTPPANAPSPMGSGPVVLPPTNASEPSDADSANSADLSGSNIKPPMDPDGRPAKVFMLITPKTTDAYVGETIPLRIEFFIRMDALAQQDSLPTIKGSDFLMNDLSVRPQEDELELANEPYHRETWITALSAVRSGDFPLEMERDTYWNKNSQGVFSDPLGNFFGGRQELAHANVPSNNFVIHSRPLPDEGKPAGFSGAIGQFKAAGNASPYTVNVGDPVYLDFSITGEGNFESVRSPVLASDAFWKSYVPSSKTNYEDESHIQGEKTFHQAIIPKRNGNLPLPAADFSYFDPTAKKYVLIPINLPIITVNGAPLPSPATSPGDADQSASIAAAPAPAETGLVPDRLEFGALRTSLVPAYRQPWFWLLQGGLLLLLLVAGLVLWLASRHREDEAVAERAGRRRSLQELQTAMSSAVARNDAPAFFRAAREAVQLQLGAGWRLRSGSVTLPVIAEHDPALAEALTPLFAEADHVMYSREAQGGHNLAEWDRRVREEFLTLQPA